MNNELYKRAYLFAEEKHKGQYRIGGEPYITHPKAVADMLSERGCPDEYIITGLFHDLLEDTDATCDEICAIGGEAVTSAVKLLTKAPCYTMEDYVRGIFSNPIARAVKACDRLHNLKCAVAADDDFKNKYITESVRWYIELDGEIKSLVLALADTVGELTADAKEALDSIKFGM